MVTSPEHVKPTSIRPKIVRRPPLPPPETNYHRTRKRFHLVFFLIFAALPFFNLMRFDLPRQRFYFAGVELWINEFAIIFFAMMFSMFVVAAMALLYGRVYCGYACPQMIFSEWSLSVEAFARKWINRRFMNLAPRKRAFMAGAAFYAVLAAASVVLAFIFTSYFVEPRDLLQRLLHLDIRTAGGITGAVVTLITFADFTLLRQRFCTTVCPYGYLQGMLQDKQTLLVIYRDGAGPQKACIECGKCVRVCHMGIDIRNSPYQIECVHCGECVDACEDVLRRIGQPGLIHYAWGDQPVSASVHEPWYKRWGFRDAKRVVILFVLLFYISGLSVALSMRRPVLVRIAPDRTYLYKILDDGRVANQMRLKIANRSRTPAQVRLWVENLPGAEIALAENPRQLAAGETWDANFELRARPWAGSQDVNHFKFLVQSTGESTPDEFDLTFILPVPKGANP